MSTYKVLLTGASGYVGGTILALLLETTESWVENIEISALVRSSEQAESVKAQGVTPCPVEGYDDAEPLTDLASQFDVVINSAAGWNEAASLAFIEGLAKRKQQTGRPVHFLGISGASSIGDRPITRTIVESRTLSDQEDIYSYLKYRESVETYVPRAADIAVCEAGAKTNVATYVVMAPHIFGVGTGKFNRFTIPINLMMVGAKTLGQSFVVGEGDAVWSHVHIKDLAGLYVVMMKNIVEGNQMPSGKQGVYFAASGAHSQLEISEMLGKAGNELGKLETDRVKKVDIEEGAKVFGGGFPPAMLELVAASNGRMNCAKSRLIGWEPQYESQWPTTIKEELQEFDKNPPTYKSSFDVGVVLKD